MKSVVQRMNSMNRVDSWETPVTTRRGAVLDSDVQGETFCGPSRTEAHDSCTPHAKGITMTHDQQCQKHWRDEAG